MINSISIPMGLLGILREAIKILKTEKLIHSIACLVLIPSSLLFLAQELALKNKFPDLVTDAYLSHTNLSRSPQQTVSPIEIKGDIRILAVELAIIVFLSFAVSFFSMVATIYASAVAYSGKYLTLKELLSKITGFWRKPMITYLYALLFNIIFVAVDLAWMRALVSNINKGSIALIVLITVGALFIIFSSQYLLVFWMLGIVVSVLEGFTGMKAFKKAKQVIEGKKLQGFLLSLVLALLAVPVSLIRILISRYGPQMGPTEVAVGLVLANMRCILQIYSNVVFTVYYCECKNRHGEKVEMDVGSGYGLVMTSPLLDDASLP